MTNKTDDIFDFMHRRIRLALLLDVAHEGTHKEGKSVGYPKSHGKDVTGRENKGEGT